jgi:hypothetical protein
MEPLSMDRPPGALADVTVSTDLAGSANADSEAKIAITIVIVVGARDVDVQGVARLRGTRGIVDIGYRALG